MQDAATIAVGWADAEGWNPGRDDAERFARADPGAFLCTERDGEVVATVSCALYGRGYAFIGFYIVDEDLRGQGFGLPLFERGRQRLRGAMGESVGLVADAADPVAGGGCA